MATGLEQFIKTLQSSTDKGGWYALDMLKKNPKWIDPLVTAKAEGLWLPELLLRNAGPNTGSVVFREPEPLYADDDIEIVGEAGTYPALTMSTGPMRMASSQKRGGALVATEDMFRRGDGRQFVQRVERANETFTAHWNRAFFREIMTNMSIPQMTARAANLPDGWHGESQNTGIRRDMAMAIFNQQNARPDGDARQDERYRNNAPDTLVLHPLTGTAFINNDEINRILFNTNAITSSLVYQFKEPNKLFNMDIAYCWEMPVNSRGIPTKALLLKRKELGFWSDERPFRATELYENKDNETWRSNLSRISLMAIDAPKKAIWINGIDGVAA